MLKVALGNAKMMCETVDTSPFYGVMSCCLSREGKDDLNPIADIEVLKSLPLIKVSVFARR